MICSRSGPSPASSYAGPRARPTTRCRSRSWMTRRPSMAQKTAMQLGCDLDQGKTGADVETITFGFGGQTYELELCSRHRKPLEELSATLVPWARKLARPAPGKTASSPGRDRDVS